MPGVGVGVEQSRHRRIRHRRMQRKTPSGTTASSRWELHRSHPPADSLVLSGCSDGTYVNDPGGNPGLVGDCEALVRIAAAPFRQESAR